MTLMDINAKAITVFGKEAPMIKLREECAGLLVAMAQFEGRRNNIGAVIDSVASVTIMMEQARLILGPEAVDAARMERIRCLEKELAFLKFDPPKPKGSRK